ncbi:MAG: PCRF domain-containing protein, partial [Dysgonamonadaceae bacterium]|nr:PCRF domain-containing protein [Dysgonamonadaceae bacterium]
MSQTSLIEKLDALVIRFEEIGKLITDPEVIADMKRFVKLNKEYRDLEKIVAARNQYSQTLTGINEAKSILENESDVELREMARDELDACTQQLPLIEEEIKLLLVPADPQDSKNAIVEIRGGTGGDEAAIFAGDLFRMYAKYCESKAWRIEVTGSSEGTIGGFKEIVFTVTGENVYGTLKY